MSEFASADMPDAPATRVARWRIAPRALSRAIAGPTHHACFVQLFFALEALRVAAAAQSDGATVLQFIAPVSGAGTSTLAAGYARVAAAERSLPVLYVDCGPCEAGGQQTLIEGFARGRALAHVATPVPGESNLVAARFSAGVHPLLDIGGAQIGKLVAALRREFAVIVLDCKPATDPASAALARHADGTVLVASARHTPPRTLIEARGRIERMGGQVVGVAFNRDRPALPRFLARRL